MNPRCSLPARQTGIALVMALVFLGVLAFLGVTIARNSTMEERMAGNTRDRDLAFQAAEAALRDAAADLPALAVANPLFNGTTPGLLGYVDANANNAAYWNTYNWAAASQEASVALDHLSAPPRYVIEEKTPTGAAPVIRHFRVTVRSVGATADSAVILQAEYDL